MIEVENNDAVSNSGEALKQNWTEETPEILDTEEAAQVTHTDMSDKEKGDEDIDLKQFFTNCLNAEEEDIDGLIEEIFIENRKRNEDILVNDENIINDAELKTEVLQHISEVLEGSSTTKANRDSTPENDDGSKKLYPESPYSLGLLILLICCFLIRFRLPDEAVAYILKIVAVALPPGHSLFRSLYHLRQFTRQFTKDIFPSLNYYCNKCYTKIEKSDKSCVKCANDLTKSGGTAYFVHLKIASQLAALWKNKDFANGVRRHRFQHFKKNRNGSMRDIYDGQLYKNLFKPGLLQDENNLSFSMNTDGAPLFKSSRVSMWPVYLLVNELPIAKRKRRQNSLFYGVWISSKKPQMWSFLEPLYSELNHLESKGESFTDFDGNSFICKCFLLTCTCDLPARAMVYNVTQFNGAFSCWFCLEKGETHKLDTGGICHIFPYNSGNPKGVPRTKKTILEDLSVVKKNINDGIKAFTVHGHKGPFWFLYLKYFNPVYSCVIDYMHGICLGVMKCLMTLWFNSTHKNKAYSVNHAKQEINTYLSKIQPTVFVTRVPRPIDEMDHWKSSEFRNFLMYWCIPIMSKVLSKEHFVHLCLLVRAFFILSMENISPADLATADGALLLFVENFERLYEKRFTTLNLHQLVHLVDCVKHTGPLFSNNCFIFEDLNGYIIKHVHGTQSVEMQLINIIGLLKAIPMMRDKYLNILDENDPVHELFLELSDSIASRKSLINAVEEGIVRVGHVVNGKLNDKEFTAVASYGVMKRDVVIYFGVNMFIKGFYVYGKLYKKMSKRQQHVITYQCGNSYRFGSVVQFIEATINDNQKLNLAIVECMKKVKQLGCVWVVEPEDSCTAVLLHNIMNVNNFVSVQGDLYVCPAPNRYDRD